MLAKQGAVSLLRRSKSSLKTLSPSSTASEVQSAHPLPGLKSMRRSSSSLASLGLASPASSFPSIPSQTSVEGLEVPALPIATFLAMQEETGRAALVQYVILFAMALQVPNYMEELMEIIETHYQSIPLLIMAGLFPTVLLNLKMWPSQDIHVSSQASRGLLSHFNASSSSLAEIEEYYRHHKVTDESLDDCAPGLVKVASASTLADEWGHFADFEESIQDNDVSFLMKPTSRTSSKSSNLGTLAETEDDG